MKKGTAISRVKYEMKSVLNLEVFKFFNFTIQFLLDIFLRYVFCQLQFIAYFIYLSSSSMH